MSGRKTGRGSDDEATFQEALKVFQSLLRIDTTNPPGNEGKACEYIGTLLRKEKIPFEILESAPGRANLVARLQGDGSRAPLLLNAHLDVVPVEKEHWSHDPFGGELDQGFVWGRGALDMKNMAAMSLLCLMMLHRRKTPLKRDLVFAAVADEEAGGEFGSGWLVENHPEKIRAEYALGEFGGFSRIVGGKHFYLVQIAEKGICWLRIRATGNPGHGSLPNWDGSVGKIGRAAYRLGKSRLPFHLTPETREFVNTLAAHQPFPKSRVLRQVLNPRWSRLVLDRLLPDKAMARSLYAVLHNTANPTVIRGGHQVNVLPAEAVLDVDGRILPGQTSEALVREVRQVIGKGYEIEVLRYQPGVSVSPRDPILGYMADALRHHDPSAIVVPYMIPGFTDATHYSRLGIHCFGFSPVALPENFQFVDLIHGHDERIPVEGFRFGLRVLSDLVAALCT
jgi:acetylornithine deacetylase/succinyl-diaminopimelate desuccinylase-like protein